IPRRTGAPPLSRTELACIALAMSAVPIGLVGGHLAAVEVCYLIGLGTLARFAVRSFRRRRDQPDGSPVPASFILLPIGLLAAVGGAVLLIRFSFGGPAWMLAAGRSLVQEGLLLGLVLAVAPMLTPLIVHGRRVDEARRRAQPQLRWWYGAAGLALVAS